MTAPARTPLYNAHVAAGGKLVDFAGWEMPVHYGSQVEEHHAVRQASGMFDVSHMTVVDIRGANVRAFLSQLVANDVAKLQQSGKALYTCMLNEQGVTILLTTHYLEEAERLCDEIAIINHGEKIAQDSTANLLGRMDSRTMVIVPDTPVVDLPVTEGVEASLREDGSLILQYRSARTSAEQVLESVRAAGIRIRDVRTEEADLEDVFLALTSSRADDAPADDQDQPRRGLHRVKLQPRASRAWEQLSRAELT